MGVRLQFSQFSDIQWRIDIGGVRQSGGEPGYDDVTAVVPQGDWQPLGEEEAERLRPTAETPASMTIELVSQDLPAFTSGGEHERVAAAAALNPLNGGWPRRRFICTASLPRQLTTTEDTSIGARIGLHVDNWDRLPYGTRLASRRRLCLNFGPGPRHLLVGDRDIFEICRALGHDQERHQPHTNDVRRYVAEEHPLRCFRIRLEPGQGYIAPTELVPHDGSTTEAESWSLAAFWLG